VRTDMLGSRETPGHGYEGVPPSQYFITLTNYMGKMQMPLVVDEFSTGYEIWNQPVAGYRFEYPRKEDYLGADPAHPHVFRIRLTSHLYWAMDGGADLNEPTPSFSWRRDYPYYEERILHMDLWLDGPVEFDDEGRIVS